MPSGHPQQEVLGHLEGRHAVLVLDNCEHVRDQAADLVSRILARCPDVAVLATSRRALGLRGEVVHRLQPLGTEPAPGDARSEAVALFVERSGAFDPTQLPDVEELCRELDGLPLAIELAAAQARDLSPTQVLRRLRQGPDSLRSHDPTLPSRQRSIANLVGASLSLLDERQRDVLARVSAIRGPFGIDMAMIACGDLGLEQLELADVLWTLVADSVVASDDGAGMTRFELPRTVRAAVLAGVPQDVRQATSERLGRRFVEALGPQQARGPSWVSDLQLELEAVRGVVQELSDGGDEQVELARQLAWSIARLHEVRSEYRIGVDELHGHLELLPGGGATRVGMLTLLADLHLRMDDVEAAVVALDEADEIAREHGSPPWDEVGRLRSRGDVNVRLGDFPAAAQCARRALADAASAQSRVRAWNLAGITDASRGLMDDAALAFEREVLEAHVAGLDLYLVRAHANLAEARLRQGRPTEAARQQLVSLDLARAHADEAYVAYAMLVAARLLGDGDVSQALLLHAAGEAALERSGHRLYETDRAHMADVRDRAAEVLGVVAVDGVLAAGRQLTLRDAAHRAEQVLRSLSRTDSAHG